MELRQMAAESVRKFVDGLEVGRLYRVGRACWRALAGGTGKGQFEQTSSPIFLARGRRDPDGPDCVDHPTAAIRER